jgi:hypothetical protein
VSSAENLTERLKRRKKEQTAVGVIRNTAGNKRKPQMGHDFDRPLRRQKVEELDGGTEDEDEFYGEWPDSMELNEKVDIIHFLKKSLTENPLYYRQPTTIATPMTFSRTCKPR